MIVVAGGGGQGDGDAVVGFGGGGPAGCFLRVVAGFAGASGVADPGRPTFGVSGDVVVVPDRGIAPGGAAGVVPGDEELPCGEGEVAAFGVAVDQVPGGGIGVEAADPGFELRGGGADQVSGDGCGDRAVTDQDGGFVVAVEQGAVGHHELDVQVHPWRDSGRVGRVGRVGGIVLGRLIVGRCRVGGVAAALGVPVPAGRVLVDCLWSGGVV